MKIMKKIGLLALVIMSVGMMSCERPQVDPNVRFYIDGQEITNDSIPVLLNTYQEVGIKAVNSGADWHFYWLKPASYPVELHSGDGNLQWLTDSYGNNRVLTLEFRMFFADSLYQHGDVCHLRCKSGDYVKVLRMVVE